jgi:alpha,alpha-trehalose phosphorylase
VVAYFDHALLIDLAEIGGAVCDGVHIASAAGTWMALVFGFGGVRSFGGELSIDPHLPRNIERLAFSLRFHDRQIRVTLTRAAERYLLDEGDPLDVTIRGVPHRLAIGAPFEVARDHARHVDRGLPGVPGGITAGRS